MAKLDNPARRLYEVLNRARALGPMIATNEVLAGALQINPRDTKVLLTAIVDLIDLTDTAKKRLQQLDIDQDLYLDPFKNIDRLFTGLNLGTNWEAYRSLLDDNTMLALQFCADTLSREMSETVIGEEELTELQTKVESLLEEVLGSTLPEELKDVLVQKLEDIRLAILLYRVKGTEGLRRALESGLGAIFLYGGHIEEIQDEKQKRTLHDVLEFMAHLAQIAGVGLQVAQLTGLVPLLPGPGGS